MRSCGEWHEEYCFYAGSEKFQALGKVPPTGEFGRGFDASNLRYMRIFFQRFPKCDALRHELSWTSYPDLLYALRFALAWQAEGSI